MCFHCASGIRPRSFQTCDKTGSETPVAPAIADDFSSQAGFFKPVELEPLAIGAGDTISDSAQGAAVLTLGQVFTSRIDAPADLDVFRLSVTAGSTYAVQLYRTTNNLDPYLIVTNASQSIIDENDDSGVYLNSLVTFTATYTGDYFLTAGSYNNTSQGNYGILAQQITSGNSSPTAFTPNNKPFASWDEAAIQLTREGASWSDRLNTSTTVTYAFRATAPATLPEDAGGFSRFSEQQIEAAIASLQAWADVANITFVRVGAGTSGEAAFSDSASILFGNYSTGVDGAAAFAFQPFADRADGANDGDVWINASLSANQDLSVGGYGLQTLLHEIGHAIGLSHPGDYNASPDVENTYDMDAEIFSDSRAFTVMSYFGSSNVGARLGSFASTPQLHDIAAAQWLYGANTTTRSGDTTYGFNSNSGRAEYTLTSSNQTAVFSIWDAGGVDTLDFSGYSQNAVLDLREEGFSSVGADDIGIASLRNVSIARGAVIENAIGGSGADTLIGNAVANVLSGGGGNDTLDGGDGRDTAQFGAVFSAASLSRNGLTWTVTAGANGTDSVTGIEFLQFTDRTVALDRAFRTFAGDATSDILFRNTDGLVAAWNVTGTTISSAGFLPTAPSEFAFLGTGDLGGDGKDDVVWIRDDGLVYTWTMDGLALSGGGGLTGIGTGVWSFLGAGDFNLDLSDDIAWRSNTGSIAIWTMNNNGIQSASFVPAGLGAEWQFGGLGDFNGDGKDDFVWKNTDNAQTFVWLMNGASITSAGATSIQPGAGWNVVGVGDTNGDGRDDILVRQDGTGQIRVLAMDGLTVLSATDIGPAISAAEWAIEGVGDYNGDGKDDILFRNIPSGVVYQWLLDGATIIGAGGIAGIGAEWDII